MQYFVPVREAVLSPCGLYRYELTRVWDNALPVLHFIMLNPSTADALADDPTIRRCIGFARREGRGGIKVCNLYAYRATNPKELASAADPTGPYNRFWVAKMLAQAVRQNTAVVCAWGAAAPVHRQPRDAICAIKMMADMLRLELHCLGKTKSGEPRHPLYIKADQPFEVYA